MDAFVEIVNTQSRNNIVHGSFSQEQSIMRNKVSFCDIIVNSFFYQLDNLPAGLSCLEFEINLDISPLVNQYNSLKPIFRSILNERIPNIIPFLLETAENSISEGKPYFRRVQNTTSYNVVVPFYLDSWDNYQSQIINLSLPIAIELCRTLLAIRTQRLDFINLTQMKSSFAHLNNPDVLKYVIENLPEGVMD